MAYDPMLGYDPDEQYGQYGGAGQTYDPYAQGAQAGGQQAAVEPPLEPPQVQAYTGGQTQNTGVTGGALAASTGTQAGTQSGGALAPAFNYTKARDEWMSGKYGGGEAGARAWAAANGITYNGGDTVTLPNGATLDIIGNFRSGRNMTNNWTDLTGGGGGGGGGGEGRALGYATAGGGAIGAGGSTTGITSNALQDQYRQTLLNLMKQGEAPVDENALGIRQPFEAGRLAAERQLEQAQTANAERLYAGGGLNSGELGQLGQQGRERAAVGLAGLKSGLITQELGARRQQLSQALQLANAIGARQEAQQLQRELAQLENQYRYAQLSQQGSQFQQQLGQQASQFGETFGLSLAQLQAQRDRDAMLAALGGGGY